MTDIEQAAFALLDPASGHIAYADTVSELVDQLIDGHGGADEDTQLGLRVDALAHHAGQAQAVVLAAAGDASAQLDEDALTVILHDRHSEAPVFDSWESDAPLFLMATSFAPYTDVPCPSGDTIVWLDPSTERSFLDALGAVGVAELMVRNPD
ncbi:hypothetical protein [Microbacterium gorillae]|uniref:hypothetical protein n=1 Tax=Microbacterium gorillae TaxID=1231063 RepID=UPI003D996814